MNKAPGGSFTKQGLHNHGQSMFGSAYGHSAYSPYSQRGVRDTMVNRSNELFDQNSGYNRQLRQNIARQGRQVGMGGLLGATLSAQGMGEAGANLVAGQRMRAINADNQANNLNAFNQAYGANQQLAQGYLQQAGAANASILQNDVEMERLKNEREASKFGIGDIFGGILGAGVGALTGGLGAGLAGGLTDSWFGTKPQAPNIDISYDLWG